MEETPAREKEYHKAEDYYNMPEDVRCELMDGKIYYMATPTRIHQGILMELSATIHNYIKEKGGKCKVYPAPFSVQLTENEDTVFEPDITVICDEDKLTDRGVLGAPDWVIEIISPTTAGNDYIRKLRKYVAAEVREYWIVDPTSNNVTVYRPAESGDRPFAYYEFTDTVPSGVFEGLKIDFREIMDAL